ncbi:MAG TPA: hypothetical protein PK156_21405 [Polyangium sp.]|nr:hypothetical protein [Polyangium sp.]
MSKSRQFTAYAPNIEETLRRAIDDLRAGHLVPDRIFDLLFPEPVRRVSGRFWTPIQVARKAAAILARGRGPVIDVGAGVGKFCVIGALTSDARFHGLEHRAELVDIANGVIAALGLSDRAKVFHGTLDDIDWKSYGSFYFCNPFEENIFPEERRYDDHVVLSKTRFHEDTARVERELDAAQVGTRVVTFHGLGARVPATYRRVVEETHGNPLLHSWIKVDEGSAEGLGSFDGWIDERSQV